MTKEGSCKDLILWPWRAGPAGSAILNFWEKAEFMCGIAGYVGDFIPGLTGRMNAVQAHRGPDGYGVFEDPVSGAALGHTRLSILYLTDAAAQPMHSPDGRFVLVYNGEIFNLLQLRHSLAARSLSPLHTEGLLPDLQIR